MEIKEGSLPMEESIQSKSFRENMFLLATAVNYITSVTSGILDVV